MLNIFSGLEERENSAFKVLVKKWYYNGGSSRLYCCFEPIRLFE